MTCPKCGSDNCVIKLPGGIVVKCHDCEFERDAEYQLGMREAYCNKCKFTTYHNEIAADREQVYLECARCGTKRTWLRLGHGVG